MRRNTKISDKTKKLSEKEKKELNKDKKSKGIFLDKNKTNEKKTKSRASSESPRKTFSKINNEIYTLNELKNYFAEIKPDKTEENKSKKTNEFNKRENLIKNLTNRIDLYILNQKNQYHEQLKKKVEKLLYVQEGSFNNGDNKSINEMYNMLNLSNSDAILNELDDEEDENTNSNDERKNIKLLQNNTEEDLKEQIPDISPIYQTLFINGFINKMQKHQKK